MGASNRYILRDVEGKELFRGTKKELLDKYDIPYSLSLSVYVREAIVYDGKYRFEVENHIPEMDNWAKEWDETRLMLRRKCGYE